MDPGSGEATKAPSIRKALIVNQIAAILPSEGFIVRLSGRSPGLDLVLLPAPSPNGWHCAGFVNPYSSGGCRGFAPLSLFIRLAADTCEHYSFCGTGFIIAQPDRDAQHQEIPAIIYRKHAFTSHIRLTYRFPVIN